MERKPFFTDEEANMLLNEIIEGYVNVNKHPTEDLYIYNYSRHTQYDWHWNDITIRCRGLILDGEGCLVAKGFDKFFTDDQLKSENLDHLIPTDEKYTISNKLDGSLGIMYFVDKTPYIATRGSFVSEMAITANGWLRDRYNHIVFDDKYTYDFEIIYPENRIVVDYGAEQKLVLLGIMDNETLEERDIYDEEFAYIREQGIEFAEKYDGFKDYKDIIAKFDGDRSKEGFVVQFHPSNFRVKMKLEWYKKAAYVLQYFTKKSVWRMIRDGEDILDIIKDIDDELYPQVRQYYNDLWAEYEAIMVDVLEELAKHNIRMNTLFGDEYVMKDFAMLLKSSVDPVMFGRVMSVHKGKDIFKSVWASIEPMGTDHLSVD